MTREMTVGVNFIVEFDTEAGGEPEAILRVGPQIHDLEEKLTKMGYNFKLDTVKVRRPRSAEKAKAREAAKRRNGGQEQGE